MALAALLAQIEETPEAAVSMPWWWIIPIGLVVGLVAWWLHSTHTRGRLRAVRTKAAADTAGLSYSAEDRWGICDLKFPILAETEGIDVSNVVSMAYDDGGMIRAFDVSGYRRVEVKNRGGDAGFSATLFSDPINAANLPPLETVKVQEGRPLSAVVFEVPAYLPDLSVRPERGRKAGHRRTHSPDLEFESEAFNQFFDIRCRDHRFATLFLDSRMIDLLLQIGDGFGLETMTSLVLIYSTTVEPEALVRMVRLAEQVRRQIPQLVLEEYSPPSTREAAMPIVKYE